MTIRQKTFAANSVLKADDVNSYLRDITVVDLRSELNSLDAGIFSAFVLEDRRMWTRGADGWERLTVITTQGNLGVGAVNAGTSAQMRIHSINAVITVTNTSGGCQVPIGTGWTALQSVNLAPASTSGNLSSIVPLDGQYTLTQVGCVARSTTGVVANGSAIRVAGIVTGW